MSKRWRWFILISVILGIALRMSFVEDMEYKEDEEYDFTQSQPGAPWAWVGMPSGVYVPNPGMSVWIFKVLAWVSRANHPTQLAHAVQTLALLGICALLPFALKVLRPAEDKKPWLWAMALALVNPFAVFYQRKLWPEPTLPFFTMIWLAGWWRRDLAIGAFAWGFVGAWLGQIHMSGFFIGLAFFLYTLFIKSPSVPRNQVRWGAWFVGSVLGALPLIPWLRYWMEHPAAGPISRGWSEAIQAKFWVFWATNPLGLHLGNTLGINRGPSHWDQVSDFVRYPLIAGHATYLNLAFHLVAAAAAAAILVPGFYQALKRSLRSPFRAPETELSLALSAAIWGFGLLLTASAVMIRRYYLAVSFPLEFVWLARMALNHPTPRFSRNCLAVLWAAELAISTCFVGYIHVNEGSPTGDYGDAYHVVMSKRK